MEAICPILNRPTRIDPTPYSRDHWSIVRCRETQLVFLANPPDYSRLSTEFAWEKTRDTERQRRDEAEPVVAQLSTLGKKAKHTLSPKRLKIVSLAIDTLATVGGPGPHRVVDIGCGGGKILQKIHERSTELKQAIEPIGIEVSEELASRAAQKLEPIGGRAIHASALDGIRQLASGSVQVVVMHSFLEHEAQPAKLLVELRSRLADDGAIVLKVPNFNCLNRHIRGQRWCGFRYPDHVNYFTPRTLKRLAEECGFRIARQRMIDKFPLSDNMYATLCKTT